MEKSIWLTITRGLTNARQKTLRYDWLDRNDRAAAFGVPSGAVAPVEHIKLVLRQPRLGNLEHKQLFPRRRHNRAAYS